jgi:hypothetical protein
MGLPRTIVILAGVGLMLVVAVLFRSGSGQPAPAPSSSFRAPRTSLGQPDLQGVWQAMNTAAWSVEDHSAERFPDLPARFSRPAGRGIVDGGEIPYQPWAREQQRWNYAMRGTADPEAQCYMPGVPRITYMPHPFQIFQFADRVVILYEYLHVVREIFTDGSEHPDLPVEFWMGDSRGRWEGDTLVVDVTLFTNQTWFDRAGNFHSDALHVVERYTRTGLDHLQYEATIEDPKVFTSSASRSSTRTPFTTRSRSTTQLSTPGRGRSRCRSAEIRSPDSDFWKKPVMKASGMRSPSSRPDDASTRA